MRSSPMVVIMAMKKVWRFCTLHTMMPHETADSKSKIKWNVRWPLVLALASSGGDARKYTQKHAMVA